MDCDEQKGIRFETGLMVLMVVFMLATGGVVAYISLDERIGRIEDILINGATPTARSPSGHLEGENGR